MTETRTSRKWFSDGALDASDDVGICTMGHGTGLGCNSTFSICISGTSTPLKTVGNDKTIYHGRAARFPVENTSKMYWKHSKMIEIKQVTRWTREIYLSRSSCPRSAPRYLIEWIISNIPGWREIPSVRRMDRTHRI